MPEFRTLAIDERALRDFNEMFDWRAGTMLADQRLLGRLSPEKRPEPASVPDRRIRLLDSIVGLSGKRVLEVGCFEGIHTLGLRCFAEDVTAIDARPVNVCKTLARLSAHGSWAKVFVADCEALDAAFGAFDVVVHIGVLYHLDNPVQHIAKLAGLTDTLLLDTHVAGDEDALHTEPVDGKAYSYTLVPEHGWEDPFSGLHPSSKRLTLDSLELALAAAGFHNRRLLQRRAERNGPRVLWIASQSRDFAGVRDIRG